MGASAAFGLAPRERERSLEDAAQLSARKDCNSCGVLVCLLLGFVLEVRGGVGERLGEARLRSRSEQSTLEFQTFMSLTILLLFLNLGCSVTARYV